MSRKDIAERVASITGYDLSDSTSSWPDTICVLHIQFEDGGIHARRFGLVVPPLLGDFQMSLALDCDSFPDIKSVAICPVQMTWPPVGCPTDAEAIVRKFHESIVYRMSPKLLPNLWMISDVTICLLMLFNCRCTSRITNSLGSDQ